MPNDDNLDFGTATGEHRRLATSDAGIEYDLRTGPELVAARMDDHQQRIAALESQLRHVERLLHLAINDADESAVGV